jgi:hypothetical protein
MSALHASHEATEATREIEDLIAASEENGGDISEIVSGWTSLARTAESSTAAIDDLFRLTREIEVRAEARKAEADRPAAGEARRGHRRMVQVAGVADHAGRGLKLETAAAEGDGGDARRQARDGGVR